jgi:hypothetical protein
MNYRSDDCGLTSRSIGPLAGGACAPSARRRLAWFVGRHEFAEIAEEALFTTELQDPLSARCGHVHQNHGKPIVEYLLSGVAMVPVVK